MGKKSPIFNIVVLLAVGCCYVWVCFPGDTSIAHRVYIKMGRQGVARFFIHRGGGWWMVPVSVEFPPRTRVYGTWGLHLDTRGQSRLYFYIAHILAVGCRIVGACCFRQDTRMDHRIYVKIDRYYARSPPFFLIHR